MQADGPVSPCCPVLEQPVRARSVELDLADPATVAREVISGGNARYVGARPYRFMA
jgi:hypothetical protein